MGLRCSADPQRGKDMLWWCGVLCGGPSGDSIPLFVRIECVPFGSSVSRILAIAIASALLDVEA